MKAVSILALAGLAAAHPHAHSHEHAKKDIVSDVTGAVGSITGALSSVTSALLSAKSIKSPINAVEPTADSWIGEATSGNAVVNTFVNQAGEDVTIVVWGLQGSWVNSVQPKIAQLIPAGQNLTISHAISSTPNTGGYAAIYKDTQMIDGQIAEPFGEFTTVNDMWGSSTFDVSFEPNMAGHNMTITTPTCKSGPGVCSFICNDGTNRCGAADTYTLVNCATGSQPGASNGQYGGQASGGCEGIAKTGITKVTTLLH